MPDVDPQQLARKVAKVEFGKMFNSFDELCAAVADTGWAKRLGLTPEAVNRLIVANKIATKMEQTAPSTSEEQSSTEEPPKRKRGRPRKNPVETPLPSSEEQPKKKRGRPPKDASSATEKPEREEEPSQGDGRRTRRLATPAGLPPVKLRGLERSEIEEWVEHLRGYGYDQGVSYSPGAVIYWLRYFCDMHSQEYREAKQKVLDIFSGTFSDTE